MKEIIEDHKKIMVFTGQLSDFQIKHLKLWPHIPFGKELKEVECSYDFSSETDKIGNAGKVVYRLKFKKNTKLDDNYVEQSLKHITNWVRDIFWQDTEVIFYKNKGTKPWTIKKT